MKWLQRRLVRMLRVLCLLEDTTSGLGFMIRRSRYFKRPPAYALSLGKNFPVDLVYSLSFFSETNTVTGSPVVFVSIKSTILT